LYSTQTNRVGLHNKIDYVFNNRNKISLYNLYLHQNEYETRYTPDTTIGTNSSQGSKSVDVEYRSRWQIQTIYNATLQGEHHLSEKVKLDWSGVYSIASNKVPDMASYNFNANVLADPSGKITRVDSSTYGSGMSRIWQHNTDKDWAGYLNLTYIPRIFHREVELAGGGLYRYKTRENYYNDYSLTLASDTSQRFTNIDAAQLVFRPAATYGTGNITTTKHANSYSAHEKIAAGYLQAKFMLTHALQVLGGVRIENTQQDYTAAMPASFDQRHGTIQYTDVLPSLHLKYMLDRRQNLRLSYFKSISRPGFGEIDPYEIPGDYYKEIGNPLVKHTRADNFDLRYELFPGLADQVLLGVFYKQLKNPIEYFIWTNGHPSDLYIQPQNADKATNYGLEAVITKYFGMFGISANYTYTHSRVTTDKILWVNNIKTSVSQTRPLQGQADHVGNLSLLFKNPQMGLDMQLAFAYTGDRIAQVSPWYGLDFWQKPNIQLDFSLEQRIARHFSFYAKINNLTNSPNKQYLKFSPSEISKNNAGASLPFQTSNSYTTVQRDLYKISFLGGFRYKF
ncbi:TonB-dependent receptor domain-containing protein, partial [Flavitalea flava]